MGWGMNTKSKYTLLIAGCLAMMLGGCAKTVTKNWQPIQGNKEDGIVTLGYYYSPSWERPIANEQQGLDTASQTCKTLGYKTAVIFDIPQAKCTEIYDFKQNGTECVQNLMSRNYQCQ